MATIPIDIKKVLEAGTAASSEQEKTVHVAILVDRSAPLPLVDAVQAAFVPQSSHALMHIESFGEDVPHVDDDADLVVIVAGTSKALPPLKERMTRQGLHAVVVTDDLAATTTMCADASYPIPAVDLVAWSDHASGDEDPKVAFENDLGNWIIYYCKDMRVAFANAFVFIRRPLALEITKATAVQNAAVGGVMIIPGADMPIMTLNQAKMILEIAAAYGQKLGFDRAKEIAAVVAGGFAFRAVARQLVGVVPAIGWAVKAGIGYSGTVAMGYAAIEYFASGGKVAGLGQKLVAARDRAIATSKDVAARRAATKAARERKDSEITIETFEVSDVDDASGSIPSDQSAAPVEYVSGDYCVE